MKVKLVGFFWSFFAFLCLISECESSFVASFIEYVKRNTQSDVVVFKIEERNAALEKILKGIIHTVPVVFVDSESCNQLEDRPVFILISFHGSEFIDVAKTLSNSGNCFKEKFWIHPDSKIIFVPSRSITVKESFSIFTFSKRFKRINSIILSPERVLLYEYFMNSVRIFYLWGNFEPIFSDKLRNVNRYTFKIFATNQNPRLIHSNGTFRGVDVFFMETVAKKLNARISFSFYDLQDYKLSKFFANSLLDGSADMNLNTMNSFSTIKVMDLFNTFDVGGYCALIPLPPRNSFFKYLLKPFDGATWIMMAVSVVALAILWSIFKRHRDGRNLNSPGFMVFRVIAMFLGQDVPAQVTRWFHVMVVQLFVFAIMILGNLYESQLISLMTVSRNGSRITTVDDMMNSNFIFCSNYFTYNFLSLNGQNTSRHSLCNEMYDNNDIDYKTKAANQTVLIMRCDNAYDMFNTRHVKYTYGHPTNFYYILPEKLHFFYEQIRTGSYSPFTYKFQELSLRIFESGIRQHWQMQLHNSSNEIDLKQIAIDNEDFLLKMDDLKFVFVICFFGLAVASITFVIERMIHGVRWMIWKRQTRKVKPQPKVVIKVKRIQVEPARRRRMEDITEEELNRIDVIEEFVL
jgi:hypothetical protein